LPTGQFKDYWESLGSNPKVAELVSTFQMPFKNMEDAVEGVTRLFGMAVCEKSNQINVTEKIHNLLLAGQFMGKDMVMIRAILGFNLEYGCVLKVCIRSLNKTVSAAMSACVQ
jgi:coatomer protein complex subunit gamma